MVNVGIENCKLLRRELTLRGKVHDVLHRANML